MPFDVFFTDVVLFFTDIIILLTLCCILQDPGWLMGVRKLNGMKGVFPENFTKKV